MDYRQIEQLVTLIDETSIYDISSSQELFCDRNIEHLTSIGDGLLGPVRKVEESFNKYESVVSFYRKDGLKMFCNYYNSFFQNKISIEYLYENGILTKLIKKVNDFVYVNFFKYDVDGFAIKKDCSIYSFQDGYNLIGKIENTIKTKEKKNYNDTFAFNYLSDKTLKQINNIVVVDSSGTIRDFSFKGIREATFDTSNHLISWYDSSDMTFIDFVDKIHYNRDSGYKYGHTYIYNFDANGNWLTKKNREDNSVIQRIITYW